MNHQMMYDVYDGPSITESCVHSPDEMGWVVGGGSGG